jgi:hypothetical protein
MNIINNYFKYLYYKIIIDKTITSTTSDILIPYSFKLIKPPSSKSLINIPIIQQIDIETDTKISMIQEEEDTIKPNMIQINTDQVFNVLDTLPLDILPLDMVPLDTLPLETVETIEDTANKPVSEYNTYLYHGVYIGSALLLLHLIKLYKYK